MFRKKLLFLCMLCLVWVSLNKVSLSAECYSTSNYADITKIRIDRLIEAVDEQMLCKDALNGVIDDQVPIEISQNITAEVEFIPNDNADEIQFEVYKTVQKVGNVINSAGETVNLYVAGAVVTDTTTDGRHQNKYDVDAYVYIYWIDNLGTNNELYAVSASWETNGKIVSNRLAEYGVKDVLGITFTESDIACISSDNFYQEVPGTYYGFVLGCTSSIDVVNQGTLKCSVHSKL